MKKAKYVAEGWIRSAGPITKAKLLSATRDMSQEGQQTLHHKYGDPYR